MNYLIKYYCGIIIIILILLTTGCKFFDSDVMYSKDIDTLIEYSKKLENIIQNDSARYKEEITKIIANSNQKIDSVKNLFNGIDTVSAQSRFLIIAGSFKEKTNATNFSDEIKRMGYEGTIISNSDNYYLVTVKSDSNLQNAIEDVYLYRQKMKIPVWIYVKE